MFSHPFEILFCFLHRFNTQFQEMSCSEFHLFEEIPIDSDRVRGITTKAILTQDDSKSLRWTSSTGNVSNPLTFDRPVQEIISTRTDDSVFVFTDKQGTAIFNGLFLIFFRLRLSSWPQASDKRVRHPENRPGHGDSNQNLLAQRLQLYRRHLMD